MKPTEAIKLDEWVQMNAANNGFTKSKLLKKAKSELPFKVSVAALNEVLLHRGLLPSKHRSAKKLLRSALEELIEAADEYFGSSPTTNANKRIIEAIQEVNTLMVLGN